MTCESHLRDACSYIAVHGSCTWFFSIFDSGTCYSLVRNSFALCHTQACRRITVQLALDLAVQDFSVVYHNTTPLASSFIVTSAVSQHNLTAYNPWAERVSVGGGKRYGQSFSLAVLEIFSFNIVLSL